MTAGTVRIEGEMTIYRAVEIKDALLAACGANGPVRVDLSGVTELDGAGVQLLLLAATVARARQCDLRFCTPSHAVRDVVSLMRLESLPGFEVPA